jgi:hypothetical protein
VPRVRRRSRGDDDSDIAAMLPQVTVSNSLKRRAVFPVQIRAAQTKRWPGQHLAREFTRYAHGYPQDLWTTRDRCVTVAALLRRSLAILDTMTRRHGRSAAAGWRRAKMRAMRDTGTAGEAERVR